MRKFSGFLYRYLVKPILFIFPADDVHTLFLRFGRFLGRFSFCRYLVRKLWRYHSPKLKQQILGLDFSNPVGLSAGFDYNADLVNILPDIGFGFHTIGTVTFEAYGGNPAPMLGRLPKSQSLLVNKGFKNDGVETVLRQLSPRDGRAVRGLSLGVNNKAYQDFDSMIENLINAFRQAKSCSDFDYYELNISCPNLRNVKELTDKLSSSEGLAQALGELSKLDLDRPLFVKMPLERSVIEIESLIKTLAEFDFVKGLVFSNLVKNRNNPAFDASEIAKAGTGNFSGKPAQNQSNELLQFTYRNYKDRFILVGVGGIFSAQDAYKKIRSGANLVALVTGMIYQGPQLIGEINQGLVKLLTRDGYNHISEAVGVDVK